MFLLQQTNKYKNCRQFRHHYLLWFTNHGVENNNKELKWNKVYSPGKEVFIKKEDNVIVTNYWIDEQEYYVKVTYTLINDQNMKAEFNGKLKGEFYYSVINYKKVKIEDR